MDGQWPWLKIPVKCLIPSLPFSVSGEESMAVSTQSQVGYFISKLWMERNNTGFIHSSHIIVFYLKGMKTLQDLWWGNKMRWNKSLISAFDRDSLTQQMWASVVGDVESSLTSWVWNVPKWPPYWGQTQLTWPLLCCHPQDKLYTFTSELSSSHLQYLTSLFFFVRVANPLLSSERCSLPGSRGYEQECTPFSWPQPLTPESAFPDSWYSVWPQWDK